MRLDDVVRHSILPGACVSLAIGFWVTDGDQRGGIIALLIWTALIMLYVGWVSYRDRRF